MSGVSSLGITVFISTLFMIFYSAMASAFAYRKVKWIHESGVNI